MDNSEIFLRAKEMTFWVLNIQQSFFLKSTGIDLIQGAKVKNLKKNGGSFRFSKYICHSNNLH